MHAHTHTHTVLASLAGNTVTKCIEHLDSLSPNLMQHFDLPLYPWVHHQTKWPSHHLDQSSSLTAQQVDAGPAPAALMFSTAGPHLAWVAESKEMFFHSIYLWVSWEAGQTFPLCHCPPVRHI